MDAAEPIRLDATAFQRRLTRLIDYWNKSNAGELPDISVTEANNKDDAAEEEDPKVLFNGAQAMLFVVAQLDLSLPFQKATALQTWLFGYEFPNFLMYVTLEKPHLHIVTSATKASIIDDMKLPDLIKTYQYRKNQHGINKESFGAIASLISSLKPKIVGSPKKDAFKGAFFDDWNTIRETIEFEAVDISPGLGVAMAQKDEAEMEFERLAARLSVGAMKQILIPEITSALDDEKLLTHREFSESTEKVLEADDVKKRLRVKDEKLDIGLIDWAFMPAVQSSSSGYDMRLSATSSDDKLQSGIILCALGIRYRNYCSYLARTLLIDPTKQQEKEYEFLVVLQKRLVESIIKEGVRACDVYNKARTFIRNNRPDLESHFLKNCGSVTGIEFSDNAIQLNAKNTRRLRSGMVMNLILGFDKLENPAAKDPKGKIYSLMISDTVVIHAPPTKSELLTSDMSCLLHDVSYYFNDEEEQKKEAPIPKSTKVIREKFRSEAVVAEEAGHRRTDHQHELFERRQAIGLERFADGRSAGEGSKTKAIRKFASYLNEDQVPKDDKTRNHQIYLDRYRNTVLLPVYGLIVPFHLSTIKNLTRTDEGDHVTLRFNFVSPGQVGMRKEDAAFEDPNATFVKSLTYRSMDIGRLSNVYKEIQDLKKELAKKEAESKELADIVAQDDLHTVNRPRRLPNVFARPTLDAKRFAGDLEIHENGIRYHSPVKHENKIDILFSNIKHFFFQPCEGELIVLLHVHLHNPIMVGKRKAKDIQFFREASDVAFDETGNRRRRNYGDDDELQAEQEERRIRAKLNQDFKTFAELIAHQTNEVSVDIPFRDLGYTGVPFRSNVLLQPTTDCLVHLSDQPFLVITLSEVEIVHLERVQFGLKNFDMVFVFSDFTRVPVHINSVPVKQLDNVKEWLDSMDIPFTEGPMNLNWVTIMKTINDNPLAFFEEGGWTFLKPDSDDEGDLESESASEFEASSGYASSSSSDYGDSNAATESDSGSEESLSESGESWDELEAKAENNDNGDGSKRKGSIAQPNAGKKQRFH